MALKKRSQVLAFFEVLSSTINRMTGFTSLSKSMNPKEYTRQYIDMEGEITDVTGYSPSLDFAFDCDTTNAVHTDLASISNDAKTGSDAERYIYSVDLTKVSGAGFVARKRKVFRNSLMQKATAWTLTLTADRSKRKIPTL